MFIKKVLLNQYKVLTDVDINFTEKQGHNVFPLISINGGGKSTLLHIMFSFIHFPFKKSRHRYLKELLASFKPLTRKNSLNKLIEFEIEHNGNTLEIEFFECKNGYRKLNFDSILEFKNLRKKKELNIETVREIEHLNKLERDMVNENIPSSLIFRELQKFVSSPREERLLRGDRQGIIKFIQNIKKNLEKKYVSNKDLSAELVKAEAEISILDDELKKTNLTYCFHFNENSSIFLYKSNAEEEELNEISDKIFLATPNTQVLHFLDNEKLSALFLTDEHYLYQSYQYYIKECQKLASGLFTYEFSTINLILEAFKKARDDDFRKAMETGKYGNQIKNTREELNKLLTGKSIKIDKDFKGVTFMSNDSNFTLTPKDLSHGELKKLSIYIWLKAITTTDSVILMDEVETGLHPTWQYELYDDLQKWSKESQFIIATHSPQIISKSYYKNLVVLKREEKGTISEQFNEAPLESDLNTIVKTIMGGDYVPQELLMLRKKYRSLFESDQLNSDEANRIKEKILEYESENSSFFKEIKFLLEFKSNA